MSSATAATGQQTAEAKSPGFWRRALRHGLVVAGGAIVLLLGAAALFGGALAPHDPNAMNFGALFAPP